MKKIIVVMFVLLMAVSAYAKDLNCWVLGDDSSITARLGYSIDPNIEVGVSANWFAVDDAPQVFGAYGLYKWADMVTIDNPIPLDFLPKELHGTPYLGIQAGLNLNNKGTFVGPVAGIIIEKVLVIEYQYKTNFGAQLADSDIERSKVVLGFRFQF